MADRGRTLEMVQRAGQYVPEYLRPSGRLEAYGWYKGDAPVIGGPPAVAEKEYDTDPFGLATSGASPLMEKVMYNLLFGSKVKEAEQKILEEAERQKRLEEEAAKAGWVGDSNRDSNRFGTQRDFNR